MTSTSDKPTSRGSARDLGLDCARALAILLVVFTHGIPSLQVWLAPFGVRIEALFLLTGTFGVELFFCLSGLLIGTILLDIERGGGSAAAVRIFMVRRWMRTLPLYFLVLVALILVPGLDPSPRDRVWSFAVMGQNLITPMPDGNWFAPSWSLAIEEWSYVLFPLMAFWLLRRTRHPVGFAACVLCVVAFAVRFSMSGLAGDWDSTARKMMVTRLDAIAYGVILAWLLRLYGDRLLRLLRLAAPASLVLLAFSLRMIGDPDRLSGLYGRVFALAVLALASCALLPLIMGLRLPAPVAAPIRFVAKISYAMYLVHWPFIFLAESLPAYGQFPVYLLGTLSVSALISYGIEQPILRMRPRQIGTIAWERRGEAAPEAGLP
jgi:peptidoglycan/LPS O-acetylase OafA/YrhL